MQYPPIYFCNIKVDQLQYTSKLSETIEIYICNVGERKAGTSRLQPPGSELAASGDTRAPPPAGLARPGGRTSISGARAPPPPGTSTGLGSAGRAAHVTGGARAPPALARDGKGREALSMGVSERRQMGGAAATRQSSISVRDGTDGVAAARRCGEEEEAEEIRRFFSFFRTLGAEGKWMSDR
jgi:hypothetical protein